MDFQLLPILIPYSDINVACIRYYPELKLALQCDARWFAEHVILTFPQILPPVYMSE